MEDLCLEWVLMMLQTGDQGNSNRTKADFICHLEKRYFVDPLPCNEMSYLEIDKLLENVNEPRKRQR
jgi:hypothetical protein